MSEKSATSATTAAAGNQTDESGEFRRLDTKATDSYQQQVNRIEARFPGFDTSGVRIGPRLLRCECRLTHLHDGFLSQWKVSLTDLLVFRLIHVALLDNVDSSAGCTLKEVGTVGIPQATVSTAVRRLLRRKWLLEQTNPLDKREKYYSIAELGLDFMQTILPDLIGFHTQTTASLSDLQCRELTEFLGEYIHRTLRSTSTVDAHQTIVWSRVSAVRGRHVSERGRLVLNMKIADALAQPGSPV